MVKFNTLLKQKNSRSNSSWQCMRVVVTRMHGNVLTLEEQGVSSILACVTSRSQGKKVRTVCKHYELPDGALKKGWKMSQSLSLF